MPRVPPAKGYVSPSSTSASPATMSRGAGRKFSHTLPDHNRYQTRRRLSQRMPGQGADANPRPVQCDTSPHRRNGSEDWMPDPEAQVRVPGSVGIGRGWWRSCLRRSIRAWASLFSGDGMVASLSGVRPLPLLLKTVIRTEGPALFTPGKPRRSSRHASRYGAATARRKGYVVRRGESIEDSFPGYRSKTLISTRAPSGPRTGSPLARFESRADFALASSSRLCAATTIRWAAENKSRRGCASSGASSSTSSRALSAARSSAHVSSSRVRAKVPSFFTPQRPRRSSRNASRYGAASCRAREMSSDQADRSPRLERRPNTCVHSK